MIVDQHHKKGEHEAFSSHRSSQVVVERHVCISPIALHPDRVPAVLGLGLAKRSQKPCLGRQQLAWRRRCAWRLVAVDHHLLVLHLRSRDSNSSSRVLECAPHRALVSWAAIRGKLECCRYAVFCCAYEVQNA